LTFVTLRLGAEDAGRVWENALRYLRPAMPDMAGLYEPDDIRERVTTPDSGWHLWVTATAEPVELVGAWVTLLRIFPRGRVLDIPFAGGVRMREWYGQALGNTEAFARDLGCDRLRCCGRRGWGKFGYEPAGTLFERKIA
jgi:hypothetical protein